MGLYICLGQGNNCPVQTETATELVPRERERETKRVTEQSGRSLLTFGEEW